MIDNRTNRDIWVHGCNHIENNRGEDALRCYNDLVKRIKSEENKAECEFYLSHLDVGLMCLVGRKLFS